jgi:hypothetical protein
VLSRAQDVKGQGISATCTEALCSSLPPGHDRLASHSRMTRIQHQHILQVQKAVRITIAPLRETALDLETANKNKSKITSLNMVHTICPQLLTVSACFPSSERRFSLNFVDQNIQIGQKAKSMNQYVITAYDTLLSI